MTLNLMEYKRNNWTLIICVVAVILVIIFIPDFLGLDSFFDGGEEVTKTEVVKEKKTKKVKQPKEEEMPVPQQKQEDSLAYFSSFTETPQEQVPQLTWEQLKSPNYQQILINAKQTASQLAASIDQSHQDSKYALYNFVTGVDFVLGNASAKMSVNDAMSYLEHLDMDVTRSFVKDALERSYFSAWEKVSLTKIIGSNRSDRFKKMSKPRFRPEVTLGSVEIRVRKAKQERSKQDIYDASKMDIDFTVMPDDAVKGEIYRDAQKVQDLNLNNSQNSKCMNGTVCKRAAYQKVIKANLRSTAVDGIYTVRLYDKDGKIFDKQYSFTKAFRLRNWRMPANQGQIIFSMPATLEYSRAERVFALRSGFDDGFVTSGDDAGFSNF